MANCPRCGAVNRPGKVACWKCLAPIPPPPPAQPSPPTPPPEPKLAAPFRRMLNVPDLTVAFPRRRAHTEQPEPDAPEAVAGAVPGETPVAAEEVIPEASIPAEAVPEPEIVTPEENAILPEAAVEEEPPAENDPVEPPAEAIIEEPNADALPAEPEEGPLPPQTAAEDLHAEPAAEEIIPEPAPEPVSVAAHDTPFALADEEDAPAPEEPPAKPARSFAYVAGAVLPHRDRTWISVMIVLTLLLAGIFVLYHHEFRDKPRPTTPQQAAQEYLFYLRENDRLSQQQLATPGSKGLYLQSWFTITGVQLISVSEADGGARATARLELAPANSFDVAPTLAQAALRAYSVEFTLEPGDDCWLVDQRTLFRSLRWEMKQANPGVTLPPWDGVSQ